MRSVPLAIQDSPRSLTSTLYKVCLSQHLLCKAIPLSQDSSLDTISSVLHRQPSLWRELPLVMPLFCRVLRSLPVGHLPRFRSYFTKLLVPP